MNLNAHAVGAVPSAMLANTSSHGQASSTWIPDTGASFHVTIDVDNIQQLEHYDNSDQIFVGNGQGLKMVGVGTSNFNSPLLPNFQLTLKNLLHVPSITKNLLNVSQFARDNHVYFEFHPNFCVVKLQGTHEVLLRGKLVLMDYIPSPVSPFHNVCPPANALF